MHQLELKKIYKELVGHLNRKHLAYLHLSHMGEPIKEKFDLWKDIRKKYNGNLMLCGDFTKETAEKAIQDGSADLIAFGRYFIANPDLVNRLKNNWPLAQSDRTNWYTIGTKGYTDYKNYN